MTYSYTDSYWQCQTLRERFQCRLLANSTQRLGYKAVGHATRTASFINDTGCPSAPEQYKRFFFF
ncbi:hypothetical protein BJP36_39670 [Moorena producens JHB]|uniref:Uncharacterized protein n=1 Tax=Moorena producens (strain JHB) TaxID=1454205 RepID=A0A9Q9SV46_MOOP1|nr:hypothetical protein [Moorena producens]WAN70172.1 hypothetical protein BJP36_39670 [Moorena producens JHB]